MQCSHDIEDGQSRIDDLLLLLLLLVTASGDAAGCLGGGCFHASVPPPAVVSATLGTAPAHLMPRPRGSCSLSLSPSFPSCTLPLAVYTLFRVVFCLVVQFGGASVAASDLRGEKSMKCELGLVYIV